MNRPTLGLKKQFLAPTAHWDQRAQKLVSGSCHEEAGKEKEQEPKGCLGRGEIC